MYLEPGTEAEWISAAVQDKRLLHALAGQCRNGCINNGCGSHCDLGNLGKYRLGYCSRHPHKRNLLAEDHPGNPCWTRCGCFRPEETDYPRSSGSVACFPGPNVAYQG